MPPRASRPYRPTATPVRGRQKRDVSLAAECTRTPAARARERVQCCMDRTRERTLATVSNDEAGRPRKSRAAQADDALSAPVAAAGDRLQNPRELSDRVAMGRALWRELVVGFAAQLGDLRLGFTQLAALYVLADAGTTTVADLADALNRSPSATSRLVDGLVRRNFVERRPESEDRRQRTLWLTQQGQALLAMV